MNIPNGYKLVPVKATDDMVIAFAETWYSKRQAYDDPDMDDAYRDMLTAAPTPPQPIYDDAAEQEAFEAVNPMPDQVTKFKGGYAPTGYSAWDAQDFCKKWDGWKQCAKSRAKAGEVGDEK